MNMNAYLLERCGLSPERLKALIRYYEALRGCVVDEVASGRELLRGEH